MVELVELIEANWPLVALAIAALLLLAWWIFAATRKTKVTLQQEPAQEGTAKRNQALIDSAPSATAASPQPAVAQHSETQQAEAQHAETQHAEVQPVVEPVAAPAAAPIASPAAAPVEAPPAPAPAPAASTSSNADDLTRIKGLGPKLSTHLQALGVTSLAQIAAWDDTQVDRIDAQLGRFQGRIRRDNWVEQAKLLSADDLAAYEGQFGKT